MCDDNDQDYDSGNDDSYEIPNVPNVPDDDLGYIERGLDPDFEER